MEETWTTPARPAELTERRLIEAFLNGRYPPHSALPGERDLARELGVTRPTLREALQRLARDGWITIQQGKSTQVNDFLWEGNLNVLGTLVRYGDGLPQGFVTNLLAVRLALAPAYAETAVERNAETVITLLDGYDTLGDDPERYATADWALHLGLIRASANPIYMLIYNGFASFYVQMARRYFAMAAGRQTSDAFYARLLAAAAAGDAPAAAEVTREAMQQSIALWQEHDT